MCLMRIWAPWSCKELLTTGSKNRGHAVNGRGLKNKESAVEWSGQEVPACGLQSLCWLPHPLIDSSIDPSILPFTHTFIHSSSHLSIYHPYILLFSHQSPIQASSNPPTRPSICPSINLSIPYSESDTIMALRNQHKTRNRGHNTMETTTKGPLVSCF